MEPYLVNGVVSQLKWKKNMYIIYKIGKQTALVLCTLQNCSAAANFFMVNKASTDDVYLLGNSIVSMVVPTSFEIYT